MKKAILFLVLLLALKAHGQILQQLGDIADAAALVAITADVLDNTLSTGDKLKILNEELERTQKLLNNPEFMMYCSTYGKNKTLREVRMHARQVQIYATTLRNLIQMLTRLSTQITATKAEDTANLIEKAAAQIKAVASGTSYLGFKGGGGDDANTVAKLQENQTAERKNTFQSNVLDVLLELDAFNQGVDQLHREILMSQSALFKSYGVGVLTSSTSLNLYSYKRAYDQKQLQIIKKAAEQNEAERRRTNQAIAQMSQEFIRVAKMSEEYQKKIASLK